MYSRESVKKVDGWGQTGQAHGIVVQLEGSIAFSDSSINIDSLRGHSISC